MCQIRLAAVADKRLLFDYFTAKVDDAGAEESKVDSSKVEESTFGGRWQTALVRALHTSTFADCGQLLQIADNFCRLWTNSTCSSCPRA